MVADNLFCEVPAEGQIVYITIDPGAGESTNELRAGTVRVKRGPPAATPN